MFQRLKNLSQVCLSNCDIDGLLNVLGTFTKDLKDLELLCCRLSSSNTVRGISELVNLERLSLKFSDCASDDFLHQVGAHCEKITFLDIKGILLTVLDQLITIYLHLHKGNKDTGFCTETHIGYKSSFRLQLYA